MLNVLLAVDGSDASNRGVKKLVETASWYREKPTVHLLTVHLPAGDHLSLRDRHMTAVVPVGKEGVPVKVGLASLAYPWPTT